MGAVNKVQRITFFCHISFSSWNEKHFGQICRENQNTRFMIRTKVVVKLKTHFMFHNYFRKSPRLRENVKKKLVQPDRLQMEIRRMRITCWIPEATNAHSQNVILKMVADKSLARPGRKQTTVTKLGIYSTYSPRSSVPFLAPCSNFCKALKKEIRSLPVQPGVRGSNDFRVGRKIANYQIFFSPGNRW